MFPNKLLICLIVLGLILGTVCVVGSETPSAVQGQVTILPPDSPSNPEKVNPEAQYQFIAPVKPSTKDKFLLLDQDAKTPLDYHQLLEPKDQIDKKPRR